MDPKKKKMISDNFDDVQIKKFIHHHSISSE